MKHPVVDGQLDIVRFTEGGFWVTHLLGTEIEAITFDGTEEGKP